MELIEERWDRLRRWLTDDYSGRGMARWVLFWVLLCSSATGLVVGVVWTFESYYPTVLIPYGCAVAVVFGFFIVWVFDIDIKRGKNNGSDRESEESPQDSGTSAGALTISGLTFTSPYYSFGFAASANQSSGVSESSIVEEVESDLPILAHRSALLRFDATDKPFSSVNPGWATFGVDADAMCQGNIRDPWGRRGSHVSPDLHCSCGFYALPPDLASTYEGAAFVTLMVELSGTVIEHEKGYRAGHQRVIECKLPACPYCGQRADILTVADHAMQQATCKAHVPVASPGQVFIDCADLATLIPVPIVRAGRVPVQS